MGIFFSRMWTAATRIARVQHVYYALAAFDVLAVATGLYLTHHVTGVLKATVEEDVRWNALHGKVGELRQVASTVAGPGNDIFESHNVEQERLRLRRASQNFMRTFEVLSQTLAMSIPGELASTFHSHIVAIDSNVRDVETATLITFESFEAGNKDGAGASMAAMNRHFGALLRAVENLSGFLRDTQGAIQQNDLVRADRLRYLEFVLCVMIVVMVAGVTVYGHWLGRLFQRRYDELEQSYAAQRRLTDKLSEANGNITQLNSELTDLNVTLEHRVRERTSELTAANASITELNVNLANTVLQLNEAQGEIIRRGKLAQLGQLTATVAHEIRNPLGAVRTAAFLVERKLKDANIDVAKPLERLNNGVARCDHIITELLDFARANLPAYRTLDLAGWLHQICAEEGKSLPPSVKVRVDASAALGDVDFDPDRLRRVIINLLSNAAEAMVGKGSDRPKLMTANPSITVTASTEQGKAFINVTDNGPGIAEEHKTKVLEPLFTTKSFGVGLGLPAVEKIMEQHAGGVRIESAAGGGATITVWLPTRQPNKKAA